MKLVLILLLLISLISGCVDTKQGSVIYNDEVIPEYSPVVDIAKKDLAGRLNLPVEDIQLVKQEKVDWQDTSLGFPEVGMMYAQVITPGFRMILKAGGKFYEYHSDYKRVVGPKDS